MDPAPREGAYTYSGFRVLDVYIITHAYCKKLKV